MESKRSVPKMVMTISTVMTVIEEVITEANCTQPYRHHNEEKYTKYIEIHKCTKSQYSQSAFQKLRQEVLAAHVPALQLRWSELKSRRYSCQTLWLQSEVKI